MNRLRHRAFPSDPPGGPENDPPPANPIPPEPPVPPPPAPEGRGRIDLRGDNQLPALLDERESIKAEMKPLADRLSDIEDEIKSKIGNAREAVTNGWKITQTLVHMPERILKPSSFMRKTYSRIGKRRR